MSRTSSQLRQAFLDYFAKHGHRIVPSSSLVPGNDPTLLFTNAGMVQFKDCFLGLDKRDYVRAVSSQRCVRAGGKHNDLENVGYTARHHTFFEMLGNFSFGDYFKKDAIHFAWEFVTGTLKIDPKRLMATVHDSDDEAYDLWHKMIGLPPEKIVRIGNKPDGTSDNFWQMGDTGPCGPCSEIFYDHGPKIPGGPPGSPDADGDRWVEIWNLVFMQFDRSADGKLTPLPKPSVDTGAGLERMSAVMQGVSNNYDIDIFVDLIREAARLLGTTDHKNPSLRVIADHIRACSFLIVDGVIPSNEGRGYVLRRIARRAMRHGHKFGVSPVFFNELVPTLAKVMGAAYPELVAKQAFVRDVLRKEGEQFARTLETGMAILDAAIAKLGGAKVIDGNTVFKLHDTYGFPTDLTADIARERNLTVDIEGYERAMDVQRRQSQAASQFGADLSSGVKLDDKTEFLGYETLASDAPVVALFDAAGQRVQTLEKGAKGTVVLERTPFYAESGGQVGDSGELSAGTARFAVSDTQKHGSAFGHQGIVTAGRIAVGDRVTTQVDAQRRAAIVLNHSATHLLHAALRKVLGLHVQQKGSLVAPDRLRFDFAHFAPVTAEQLAEIEALVNEQIRLNHAADIRVLPYDEAIAAGALAFFGDKYGDKVRVLKLGDFSTELCGGTHVSRSGDIGLFKIVSEGGIAAGVRRIEAVTGQGALDVVNANEAVLREVAGLVRAGKDDIPAKVGQLVERMRSLERELATLRRKLASGGGRDILQEAQIVNGIKVLSARLDGADAKALRDTADQLKSKLGSGVVVLGAVEGDKVFLVASVTPDLTGRLKAGELIKPVAELVGGRGGGRPDFAQAGGTKPDQVDAALALVPGLVAAA
ncbi:MAG TPA: alanine--tRNA ligase [Gammaproteobacteria bacterium]|nr:alanine--tRNA ligase [Gammaproteobacteria bacterium]